MADNGKMIPRKRARLDREELRVKCSIALKSILARSTFDSSATELTINEPKDMPTVDVDINDFFRETWQKKPQLYRSNYNSRSSSENEADPINCALAMGWDGLASVLHNSRTLFKESMESQVPPPLIFRNQQPLELDEILNTYNNNPFAAYLDGCSVVQNHADLLCPSLSKLSMDMQQSFPHVYINTYLTPPKASAVTAHADDRDVFVVQLEGEKHWIVYPDPPIIYPYPHEQVGKQPNLPVPITTLNSTPLFETILKKGDVLYMPRGYVHEAKTNSDLPSYHATIALATHDWSLSCTITQLMRNHFDQIPDFRMAISPQFGRQELSQIGKDEKETLTCELDRALKLVKESLTVESVADFLGNKYQKHNLRAAKMRDTLTQMFEAKNVETKSTTEVSPLLVIGPEAATRIRMSTKVRASTQNERNRVQDSSKGTIGLTVRDDYDTSSCLVSILAHLKRNPFESCTITDLGRVMTKNESSPLICDLTLYAFAQCCIELGAMAIATD